MDLQGDKDSLVLSIQLLLGLYLTQLIAHRGYLVNGDPENSIPAFQTAIHYGAEGIELDVHLTSDHKLICFHDDSLLRLGSNEFIKDLTSKKLKSIELAEGVYIPSLGDVLQEFGNKTLLNIEMKSKNGIKELIDLINQYNIKKDPKNLIISSFHHDNLSNIKNIDQDIPTGLLCGFIRGQFQVAQKLRVNAIHPYYDTVPKDFTSLPHWLISYVHKSITQRGFKKAKKLNFKVNPWIVNSERFIFEAFKRNVDGIITDNLEKALTIKNTLFAN
jgi:glycerophosphoryl diester phosphodiesterase